MTKKVLVIGGAGYIGSHTCKALVKLGHEVVNFDNLSTGFAELAKFGKHVNGDLRIPTQINECLENFQADAVFHFANFALVGESVSDPAKYYENNVIGSFNLFEAIRKYSPQAKIIFSSSCTLYGEPKGELNEMHPIAPMSPYGQCKWMVEKMLADYETAYNLKHVNLRYFNASGADSDCELGEMHDPESHLIPRLLNFVAQNKLAEEVKIFGDDFDTKDGTCVRDYIHIEDLATAHILAMEHLLAGKESVIVNLGNQIGYSVREIITRVETITGKKLDLEVVQRRAGDPPYLVASGSFAKEIWNWQPKHDLDSIIKTAWEWTQKQSP